MKKLNKEDNLIVKRILDSCEDLYWETEKAPDSDVASLRCALSEIYDGLKDLRVILES